MYYMLFTKYPYNKYHIFSGWTESKKIINKVYSERKRLGLDVKIAMAYKYDINMTHHMRLFNDRAVDRIMNYNSGSIFYDQVVDYIVDNVEKIYGVRTSLFKYIKNKKFKNISRISNNIIMNLYNKPSIIYGKELPINIDVLNLGNLFDLYLKEELI